MSLSTVKNHKITELEKQITKTIKQRISLHKYEIYLTNNIIHVTQKLITL